MLVTSAEGDMCVTIPSSSYFLRIPIKKFKIQNPSPAGLKHPRAPISIVLKLLRSTSRRLPRTAEHICFLPKERPRTTPFARRGHFRQSRRLWQRRWFHFRFLATSLRHVLADGRTSKVLGRRRWPLGVAVGCVVRVVAIYRGETAVCALVLNGVFLCVNNTFLIFFEGRF